MSKKGHRSGGKYATSHTTVIPAAELICDILDDCEEVTKIAVGFIRTGLKANGTQSVKITDESGHILLTVKGNTSSQEIFVYTRNVQTTKLAVAREARNKGMRISFRKDCD